MASVFYVADGPRDHATLPRLVESALHWPHDAAFEAWHDIKTHGRGYERKLAYAVRAAKARGHVAVVAVVDNDRARTPRLDALRSQREAARGVGVPTAIGEAYPHVEAWLVDDVEPLRSILGHPATDRAPAGRDPKAELDALIEAAGRADDHLVALGEVAAEVRLERCRRAHTTGFERFVHDVHAELGALPHDALPE